MPNKRIRKKTAKKTLGALLGFLHCDECGAPITNKKRTRTGYQRSTSRFLCKPCSSRKRRK